MKNEFWGFIVFQFIFLDYVIILSIVLVNLTKRKYKNNSQIEKYQVLNILTEEFITRQYDIDKTWSANDTTQ